MSSPFDELKLPPGSPEQKRRANWNAKRSTLIVGGIVALVVVIGVGAVALLRGDGMTEFSSAEGKFKVRMPKSPKVQTKDVDGATMKAYMVEEHDGAYLVAFMDLPMPDDVPPELIEKILAGVRNGATGKVTEDKRIKLADKYPGQEVTWDYRIGPPVGESVKGVNRTRYYIVGKRTYTLTVNGKSDWANSANATKFLDSFQLTQ